tara:strand:- start:272 stop:556 length:285 start_codon:yes stop_codon:yes gene_type:complete
MYVLRLCLAFNELFKICAADIWIGMEDERNINGPYKYNIDTIKIKVKYNMDTIKINSTHNESKIRHCAIDERERILVPFIPSDMACLLSSSGRY